MDLGPGTRHARNLGNVIFQVRGTAERKGL